MVKIAVIGRFLSDSSFAELSARPKSYTGRAEFRWAFQSVGLRQNTLDKGYFRVRCGPRRTFLRTAGNFVQDDLHGVKWCGTLCCTAMRQWPNGRAPDSHSGDCGFESRLPLCCDMVYMCATISSAVCSGHICGSGLIW